MAVYEFRIAVPAYMALHSTVENRVFNMNLIPFGNEFLANETESLAVSLDTVEDFLR